MGEQHQQTVIFDPSDLASKWGFSDGDLLADLLWDLEQSEGVVVPPAGVHSGEHRVLIAAVRRWVVPVLDGVDLDIYEIGSIHNPIRCRSVNGREVDDRDPDDVPPELAVEPVVVPVEEVRALARAWRTEIGDG